MLTITCGDKTGTGEKDRCRNDELFMKNGDECALLENTVFRGTVNPNVVTLLSASTDYAASTFYYYYANSSCGQKVSTDDKRYSNPVSQIFKLRLQQTTLFHQHDTVKMTRRTVRGRIPCLTSRQRFGNLLPARCESKIWECETRCARGKDLKCLWSSYGRGKARKLERETYSDWNILPPPLVSRDK